MQNILNRLEKIMHECRMIQDAILRPEKQERKVAPGFEKFWALYPKKENLEDTQREWDNHISEFDAIQILKTLENKKWDVSHPRFIPCPNRWLKNKKWLEAKKEANDGKYKGRSETV